MSCFNKIYVIIIVLILCFGCGNDNNNQTNKVATRQHTNQIDPYLKQEIDQQIGLLFLKHGIKLSPCKKPILKFYYYQNSNDVLDGDVPYPVMTAEKLSNIATSYGCPEDVLADIILQYEKWAAAEEKAIRNADDIFPEPEVDHDNF